MKYALAGAALLAATVAAYDDKTAYVNSVEDFCLYAPPSAGPTIGDAEAYVVSYCTTSSHGTRVMPAGTIQSAHFLTTPHYTQVTGYGDFTKINVQSGDEGGELDPHGATNMGNPVGGVVYSNGVKVAEWTTFISYNEFCFRVCPQNAGDSYQWCNHIYDLQGCQWNEPGNYGGGFDTCQGDSTQYPPGIYNVNGKMSTYAQGDGSTPAPPAAAAGKSSNCQQVATVGGGAGAASPAQTTPASNSNNNNAASSNGSGSSSSSKAQATSSGNNNGQAQSTQQNGGSSGAKSSSSSTTSAPSSSSSSSSTMMTSSTMMNSTTVMSSTTVLSTPALAASPTTPAAGATISRTSNAASKVAGAGSLLAGLAAAVVYWA